MLPLKSSLLFNSLLGINIFFLKIEIKNLCIFIEIIKHILKKIGNMWINNPQLLSFFCFKQTFERSWVVCCWIYSTSESWRTYKSFWCSSLFLDWW
jgi:hypothetical protein